eukprot:TRINITY_DN15445_c0_g2_i1.p1 TRINITY_DN15445_c0_g2~~TRINITY_DN15445_c0_g2_i1.p1  ORF type:complete len:569 (-),score=67.86 TRINITY_DN15445_c0_g2_i1:233-1939(-)
MSSQEDVEHEEFQSEFEELQSENEDEGEIASESSGGVQLVALQELYNVFLRGRMSGAEWRHRRGGRGRQFPLLQDTDWQCIADPLLMAQLNQKTDASLPADNLYKMMLYVQEQEQCLQNNDDDDDCSIGIGDEANMIPKTLKYPPGIIQAPVNRLIRAREVFGPLKRFQQRSVQGFNFPPLYPHSYIDRQNDRAYIGQFSGDGSLFWVAFQDARIRLYDVDKNFRLRKEVAARDVHWTITDTSVSPDQRFMAYSTLYNVVHMVNVGSNLDCVHSLANVTEIHHGLNFGWLLDMQEEAEALRFGIFSLDWGNSSQEIAVGTNDQSFAIYDVQRERTTHYIRGHSDDVDTVVYRDDSNNELLTGSDDANIFIWDKRTLPSQTGEGIRPEGGLIGHTEGVTHIHSKGDGIHFLSNGKDQRAKMWDIRKCMNTGAVDTMDHSLIDQVICRQDYRWAAYPLLGQHVKHPYDCSVQEYRGHTVQGTLIRAYISPEFNTGGRYVYSGSYTGNVHVYDAVTAHQVAVLEHHKYPVRDCSWHPHQQMLATVAWDGQVVQWQPREEGGCAHNTESKWR